jgi:hypothetical protein
MGVGAGLVAAAAFALLWEWGRPEGKWLRETSARGAGTVKEAGKRAAQIAGQGVAAAKRTLGLKKPAPEPVRAEPQPLGRVPSAPVPEPLSARAVTEPTSVELPRAEVPAIWEVVGWAPGSPEGLTAEQADADRGTVVFSAANKNVSAPELVRPRLPVGVKPGVRVETLPEVELVISETGEVESARLVNPGAGTKAAMMLSAVKAWRFQPAMLNGEPVRYRLRLRLIG